MTTDADGVATFDDLKILGFAGSGFRLTATAGILTTESDPFDATADPALVIEKADSADPVDPGATITYTITVEVTGAGTATASVISDPIPTFSTYAPGSITLNAAALSDAIDADVGEFDTSGAPTVVVRLGDLTQADGIQTIVFQVTIN
ncbi:MAG: DUF11 domain-containing protein [Proteobacteria bacterium]|nr:DUF11 domain-containing protein [Pseudomonadota bacterium]